MPTSPCFNFQLGGYDVLFYCLNVDASLKMQCEIYARQTPAQKLHTAYRLYLSAKSLKEAGLKQAHPDWSPDQIQKAVREAFMYARE
jgi:hypothetical protein